MEVQEKRTHFAVGIPIEEFPDTMFRNLMALIAARADLLKKALGTETLAIVYMRGKLWFPWFTIRENRREAVIYRHFVYFLWWYTFKKKSFVLLRDHSLDKNRRIKNLYS